MPVYGECKNRLPGKPGAPQSDSPVAHASEREPNLEVENQVEVDVEDILAEEEADRRLREGMWRSLRQKLRVSSIN